MNTKFFFVLLVVALVLTACAPAITGVSAPVVDVQKAVPGAEQETSALVPVTGVRTASEPRLFSGEIFLSDNNNPDRTLQLEAGAEQKPQDVCISEDSLPKRVSGCIE